MTQRATAQRAMVSDDLRRGACPTLSAPMPTGDGLLARLRPLDCLITTAELRAIAEAAAEFGNGILEVTARGSLQIRGLRPETVAPFERAVLASGIVPASGVMVEVPPLAGIDFSEVIDPRQLARKIRQAIETHVPPLVLAPKLAVIVDGRGRFHLGDVTADVRLTAIDEEKFLLAVGGTNRTARPIAVVSADGAVAAVIRLLEEIAEIGPIARGRDVDLTGLDSLHEPSANEISVHRDVEPFLGIRDLGTPPSVLPDISPSRGEIDSWGSFAPDAPLGAVLPGILAPNLARKSIEAGSVLHPISPLEGEMSGRTEGGIPDAERGENHILGIAFPYRQANADDLIAFIDTIETIGISEIRLSPAHGFFLTGLSPDAALQAEAAARRHHFWTSSNDPRANIALCSGTSGCASAFYDTRATAEALRRHAPALLDGSLAIHLSGCAKGCAHPSAAPLTLVGAPSGYGLVVNGVASAKPAHYIAAKDLGIAVERLASLVAGAKEAGETARDCLARLGADRISAALILD
ncbi:precorrin-3B synthase [Rhizobium sp. TH2]|uniref:precorrin-3B synthase n=1 Tax=Rhizobium sp. TH2 TaxID=2775403 RepID=UPI0021573BBC|nr:precorrin-3B synthase [Rhizobium sp. TH2]UVC10981.1 precorrin-3B synthase [Rhizobium sp. TH2]